MKYKMLLEKGLFLPIVIKTDANSDYWGTVDRDTIESLEGDTDEERIVVKKSDYEKALVKYYALIDNERLCQKCNVQREYYMATFDNYKTQNKMQEAALKACRALVKNKTGKVVLLGSNGLGKTMLASICAKSLKGKIVSLYELACIIKGYYKTSGGELGALKDFITLPFLAIDEIGRSYDTKAESNWLSYIIDKRHTGKLATMLCSNLSTKEFGALMGNDILDRLRTKDTKVITLEGTSWRQKQ